MTPSSESSKIGIAKDHWNKLIGLIFMKQDIKKVVINILESLPDNSTREDIVRELRLRLSDEDELISELDEFMAHAEMHDKSCR